MFVFSIGFKNNAILEDFDEPNHTDGQANTGFNVDRACCDADERDNVDMMKYTGSQRQNGNMLF